MSSYSDTSDSTLDPVYTVSELNREVRYLLEGNFPSVLVEGELSNIAMPSSGHWYFTLKDDKSQIRCAMFRNRNMLVRFRPEDGSSVRLKGRLSLYEGRGDYQLIVDRMEAQGDGALRQAFERLKEKLLGEGLFDEAAKQDMPEHIRHIGIITSPTGAAVRDIISVLRRRFPAIRLTILPVSVQGQNAAGEMIRALHTANQRKEPLQDLDVLILGRGGGSLEDLWSFNDEALARAIFASRLPVVSAVGHEVDFSIADFVADLRAATPTAAAELLSPHQDDYLNLFRAYEQQFAALMQERIEQQKLKLQWLRRQLRHPGRRLQEHAQSLDALELRFRRALRNEIHRARAQLQQLSTRLRLNSPLQQIRQQQRDVGSLGQRLHKGLQHLLDDRRQQLAQCTATLNAVSPLATLSRGYAITWTEDGQVVRSYRQVNVGDMINTRLHQGSIHSVVTALAPVKADTEKDQA